MTDDLQYGSVMFVKVGKGNICKYFILAYLVVCFMQINEDECISAWVVSLHFWVNMHMLNT